MTEQQDEAMARLQGLHPETLEIPKKLDTLLKVITRDFTYYTVLMAYYNAPMERIRIGKLMSITGETKAVLRPVIDHFLYHKILVQHGGLFPSYQYNILQNENQWHVPMQQFAKLMKYPKYHRYFMGRITKKKPVVPPGPSSA